MKKYIISGFLLLSPLISFTQTSLSGIIMDPSNSNDNIGIEGVSVHWLDTNISAISNSKGSFKIPYKTTYKKLIISFLGYQTDTITVLNSNPISHFLTPQSGLDEVVVITRKKATHKSFSSTANQFTVNSDELLKAACCNLAESFETNPSIDVSFSDALTGTKQVQMLGLTSPYLLISQENIPSVRGASQVFGLTFTPGTWVGKYPDYQRSR
jgi:hypothetical protein